MIVSRDVELSLGVAVLEILTVDIVIEEAQTEDYVPHLFPLDLLWSFYPFHVSRYRCRTRCV